MKQQRLKAYLALIQELLNCPNGEEWIRLRQHEDLVDAGLVQTMEQVATTLAQEGRQQEAIFLHNWAGQLHHILAQPLRQEPEKNLSQAYVNFISALLGATPEEQQNLIVANQHLVTPGLVQMMRQVSAQLAAQGEQETASYLNRLAEELGKLWLQHHQFEQAFEQRPLKSSEAPTAAKSASRGFKPEATFEPVPPLMQDFAPVPPPDRSATEIPSEELAQFEELPDPWGGLPREPAGVAQEAVPLPQPMASPTVEQGSESALPAETLQQVEAHLAAIAAALTQVSEQLSRSIPPPNPIGHLESLEKAHQSGWILTTDEVEALIATHPKCAEHTNTFERGSWRFIKVGKVGQKTGWKVEKVEFTPDVAASETL